MVCHEAEDMLGWEHGGGFSLDASVRIEARSTPCHLNRRSNTPPEPARPAGFDHALVRR